MRWQVPVLTGHYYGAHAINAIFNYVLPYVLLVLALAGLYPLAGASMQKAHAAAQRHAHTLHMPHLRLRPHEPPHATVPVGGARQVDAGMDAAGIPADMPPGLVVRRS